MLTGNFDADEPIAKPLSALYSILLPFYWYGRTIYDTHETSKIGTMLMRVVVAGLVYVVTLGIGVIVSAFMVGA